MIRILSTSPIIAFPSQPKTTQDHNPTSTHYDKPINIKTSYPALKTIPTNPTQIPPNSQIRLTHIAVVISSADHHWYHFCLRLRRRLTRPPQSTGIHCSIDYHYLFFHHKSLVESSLPAHTSHHTPESPFLIYNDLPPLTLAFSTTIGYIVCCEIGDRYSGMISANFLVLLVV